MLALNPGGPLFVAAVVLSGSLVFASVPLLVVSAQDLAPHARASASGIVMGFTTGAAGILYVGVGKLQAAIGLEPAMTATYLLMIPAGLLALAVLAAPPDEGR